MIKKIFLILSLLTCTFLPAMDKYKNIKPNIQAPLLLTIAARYTVKQTIIDEYAQFIVDPAKITKITKEPCVSPDTESYNAELRDGNNVCCTYFPSGECAGQIWAIQMLPHEQLKLKLPIDQKNFFILKSHYEKQTNS